MRQICKKCGIHQKRITGQGYCAKCHLEETGQWAIEFSDTGKKK